MINKSSIANPAIHSWSKNVGPGRSVQERSGRVSVWEAQIDHKMKTGAI
jgi:hypothetical protein